MPVCNAAACPRPALAGRACGDGSSALRSMGSPPAGPRRRQAACRGGGDDPHDLHPGDQAEAFAPWDKVADALRDKHDKLGALMDAAREDVLT
jgi:hypothetical protein